MRTDEKPTAQSVWEEYQRGERYNNAVELYDKVTRNENFMIGKQWEGVNAPDLPKPVLNIAKRVTAYFISMIVSDDVGVAVTPYGSDMEPFAKALEAEVSRVIELDDIRPKNREIVRNAAVDGDGFLYFYFDPDAPGGMDARGRIRSEVVDNTRVMFGNHTPLTCRGSRTSSSASAGRLARCETMRRKTACRSGSATGSSRTRTRTATARTRATRTTW